MYIKIGSFFLVGIFLFFLTLLSIREVDFLKGAYVITVKFDFAEGLRPSSPIRFCGVDVGEVKKVIVREEGKKPLVYVQAKVRNGIRIPKDSYFFINSLSLFGEKYLEIDPPSSVTTYINEGEIIEGISPVPLFDVFASFTKTMKDVRTFIKEGKIKTSLENIFDNMESISFEVKGLVEDMKGKQGTIGRLLYDDSLYDNMESISLELKGLIEDMKDKQGTIGRLFYDDSLYKTTEEFIEDIKNHPWKLLHKPKETKKKQK